MSVAWPTEHVKDALAQLHFTRSKRAVESPMKITAEHQATLHVNSGICANEACDACGKVLGAVRYRRRGGPGEWWCSEACRDGQTAVEARAARRRGRPRKYKNTAEKQKAY